MNVKLNLIDFFVRHTLSVSLSLSLSLSVSLNGIHRKCPVRFCAELESLETHQCHCVQVYMSLLVSVYVGLLSLHLLSMPSSIKRG